MYVIDNIQVNKEVKSGVELVITKGREMFVPLDHTGSEGGAGPRTASLRTDKKAGHFFLEHG